MSRFFTRTLWSGLFAVLILGAVAVVLVRIVETAQKAIDPIESHLPIAPAFPSMWAVVLLVALAFLAGLALKVSFVERAVRGLEEKLAAMIPLFRIAAGVRDDLLADDAERPIRPALFQDGDKLVPVFLVESTVDGDAAVFFPESGNPTSGTIAIVRLDHVRVLDMPTQRFIKFIKSWGKGVGELVGAGRGNGKSA